MSKLIGCLLCCFLAVFAVFTVVYANPTEKPYLRGVTILYTPFVRYYNGTYHGFLIDLMNQILEKVGFEYDLYFTLDAAYGRPEENGSINGLIGEVNKTIADFGLADLIISENRKPFVDFTIPYLVNRLAMVINKDYAKCMTTLEDLINYNDQLEEKSAQIAVGFLGSGSTYRELSTVNDTIGQSLFEYAMRNKDNMVKSNWEGVQRARDSRFGMIMLTNAAEYNAQHVCNLTVLYDNRDLVEYEYAIALPKGSKWLEPFNQAIQELIDDGSIERLRKSNWISHCVL